MARPCIVQFALDPGVAEQAGAALIAAGYRIVAAATARELARALALHAPSLLVAGEALETPPSPAAPAVDIPVVLLVADESEARAVRALRSGAADYFHWPGERMRFLERVRRLATAAQAEDDELTRVLIGASDAMREVRRQVRCAALTDSSVLLVGETGTGKELAAGLLHRLSARRAGPFVGANCAAIPDTLLESELFGYERGAFTGALASYEGKLQQAHGGTLFLDEVGDMSLVAQAKVLRAFESKPVYRLGGRTPVSPNVRLVSATNCDLAAATAEGRFRRDLLFRLSVAEIQLPALREHAADIPELVEHYVRECNERFKRPGQGFTRSTVRQLAAYAWPGNVRELRNVIEATFVNSSSRWLSWTELPIQFRRRHPAGADAGADERERLLSVLADVHWNKSEAANRLHWSRMTLYRKLAKYRLSPG